jgi:glycine/D-amino acid oxidase-like deaminating enzyme
MPATALGREAGAMKDYRQFSMWLHDYPGDLTPRPALPGPQNVDVAIVGGGLTGLWTAYYLKKADSGIRVAIIEANIAGFGASGRNGGWCSGLFATAKERLAERAGRAAAIRMQRALWNTVDEVGRVVADEAIDARFHKGGMLEVAVNAAQLERVRSEVDYERSWGAEEDDYTFLSAQEARERVAVAGCLGALYTPHCACVDPARLTRGLAEVVERLGVALYESTPALAIAPGYVITGNGLVHADVVVRATEAFTPSLPGYRREYVPVYSLMIGTEPLPQSFWDETHWGGRETLTDGRHLIIYAMRTEDGRIAMGGRGAPYHFSSQTKEGYDRDARVFGLLRASLTGLFPQLAHVRLAHHWGGAVALPRDWWSSVGLHRATGLAWAGGYVGDGVATTNLAGRTLADLITRTASDLVALPWVNHHSRKWEPEPIRWLGVNLTLAALRAGDREEARTGKPSRLVAVANKLIGQ